MTRIFIGLSENDKPEICFFDRNAKKRISIYAADDSSSIILNAKHSKRHLQLWVWEDKNQAAGIQLADEDGCERIQLQLEENGNFTNTAVIGLYTADISFFPRCPPFAFGKRGCF